MSFLNTDALIWVIPALIFPVIYLTARKRRKYYRILMTGNTADCQRSFNFPYSLLFMVLTLVFLILALLRPVSNPRLKELDQSGRNLVFVIDVSRSMLAEDLAPNRLERAKYDILNSMAALSGNRVALVAFAGSSVLKCPLTLDYNYFSQALYDLSVNSVSRGGTKLGDAIRIVIDDLFDPQDRQAMDIILITDGEDQDSFPLESAARAGQEGIRIIALGLGNQSEGSAVPGENETETLSYQNQPVYSRADMKTLEAMAAASRDGWAVAVESGRLPVQSILQRLSMKAEDHNTGKSEQYVYDEHYRWALIPALLCFLMAILFENTAVFRRRGV